MNVGRFRDRLAKRDVPCLGCGYNLRGCEGDRCPECGELVTERTFIAAQTQPDYVGVALKLGVIAVAILLVVAILLPTGTSGRPPVRMQNSTQVRGIHQGMVMFAQSNGLWFPGLDAQGNDVDVSVEGRLEVLLLGNYFTGEYLLNPAEPAAKREWTTGVFSSNNYSYSLLSVPAAGARRNEWRDTLNTEAITVSDRFLGTATQPRAVNPQGWGSGWAGAVAYNDNHVEYEKTHILPTNYAGTANPKDHLFLSPGKDDALMIHSGK